jgi:hypothetical protein
MAEKRVVTDKELQAKMRKVADLALTELKRRGFTRDGRRCYEAILGNRRRCVYARSLGSGSSPEVGTMSRSIAIIVAPVVVGLIAFFLSRNVEVVPGPGEDVHSEIFRLRGDIASARYVLIIIVALLGAILAALLAPA